jgi:hypothetical protein
LLKQPDKHKLTRKQRQLVNEIGQICRLLGLDFYDIDQRSPEGRTPMLANIKRHIIRGEIVSSYTLVDELLSAGLCFYFFGTNRSFLQLWKTKRFKIFNYHILETLSLNQKLAFFSAIWPVPKNMAHDIRELNALRNGLAHSFFPENRRTSKPVWKGKSIFSLEGLGLFNDDTHEVTGWLSNKVFG